VYRPQKGARIALGAGRRGGKRQALGRGKSLGTPIGTKRGREIPLSFENSLHLTEKKVDSTNEGGEEEKVETRPCLSEQSPIFLEKKGDSSLSRRASKDTKERPLRGRKKSFHWKRRLGRKRRVRGLSLFPRSKKFPGEGGGGERSSHHHSTRAGRAGISTRRQRFSDRGKEGGKGIFPARKKKNRSWEKARQPSEKGQAAHNSVRKTGPRREGTSRRFFPGGGKNFFP